MLIRFTVENFRSFAEETVFSTLPGRAKKHADHIIPTPVADIAVLRAAVIYGANASGKSNLVRAIAFARQFIVDGLRPKQPVPVEPFRLNAGSNFRPSRFEFEFVAGGQVYAYGFAADRQRVHDEWLYVIRSAQSEYSLFQRISDEKGVAQITFGNAAVTSGTDRQFLDFVARTVRPNQLLLTKMAENNVDLFEPPYEWFRTALTIIFPDSFARSIQLRVHKDQRFSQALAAFLQDMNTGITEVCTTPVKPDEIDFPLDLLEYELNTPEQSVEKNNGNGEADKMLVLNGPNGRYLIHRDEAGALRAYVLHTRHYAAGQPVDFQLAEESDGTQRLFDLFPVLYGATDRVFIIDELERSLHPNLVRHFIRQFLRSAGRNQLIVTTHESTLLDLTLLRRDEIWFVEKSPSGVSAMYSLEAFKPRHDLDIRKGYLQGRFGAIPVFGSRLFLEGEEA